MTGMDGEAHKANSHVYRFLRACEESLDLEEYAANADDEGGKRLIQILSDLAEMEAEKYGPCL